MSSSQAGSAGTGNQIGRCLGRKVEACGSEVSFLPTDSCLGSQIHSITPGELVLSLVVSEVPYLQIVFYFLQIASY
jgi:hypothetical protein